ncbi:MAG: sigma-54 dependent transcriptional regulator [Thermoanaerobaculales bacterium]|nr:sigma-54 dependent transcriptional regulator [Thermoanaerobaculales bacterium]
MTMRNILIIDDDVAVTNYLMVFLMQSETFEPTVINESLEVPLLLEQETFDIILLDMDMPNLSGIDLLKIIHEKPIDTPVIVLSGVNDVDLAVKALKLGAFDYLTKPVDDEYLLEVIEKAIRHRTLHDHISKLPDQLSRDDLAYEEAFSRLPTQNPEMIHLLHRVEKIATGCMGVFVIGGRGTGKGKVAEAIHNASPRKEGPFVAVNAAAHDSEQFAADFFGQATDWTGEHQETLGLIDRAEGGTLYISNIECLSAAEQHRLDRLIRTGEFYREGTTQIRSADIRIIGGSTKDLRSDAYRDSFSQDLLYHLWVNLVQLPLLRDRVDDIPLLAEHYLKRDVARTGIALKGIAPELSAFLQTYAFPGNLEELRDVIATCVRKYLTSGKVPESGLLGVDSLSNYMRDTILAGIRNPANRRLRPLSDVIHEHVTWTVDALQGDFDRAAQKLEITVEDLEAHLRESNRE